LGERFIGVPVLEHDETVGETDTEPTIHYPDEGPATLLINAVNVPILPAHEFLKEYGGGVTEMLDDDGRRTSVEDTKA